MSSQGGDLELLAFRRHFYVATTRAARLECALYIHHKWVRLESERHCLKIQRVFRWVCFVCGHTVKAVSRLVIDQ